MNDMEQHSKPKNRYIFKLIVLILCAAASVISILFIYQKQSVVMYVAISVTIAVLTLFWSHIKSLYASIMKRRVGRVVIKVIVCLIVVAMLYAIVISALMIGAMFSEPTEDATLIVLGCQVRGEQPSLMLSKRIGTALEYLRDNPDVPAVLSGGQGPGEDISEAEAIYRRLTAGGIDVNRLFQENVSTSTNENVNLSAEVIKSLEFSTNVAIVTDGFHQYRAQYYAKNAGLSPGAVSSNTPFYVLPYYWLREIAAITQQVVFGINELPNQG